MSTSKRGSTHAGQPVLLPDGHYAPPPPVEMSPSTGLVVHFEGEDDRNGIFRVDQLPLPGWHSGLAAAFATVVGPAGPRRTRTSAQLFWGTVGRVMRFLITVPDPPSEPARLRPRHLKAFHQQSTDPRVQDNRWRDLREFKRLLDQHPLRDQVPGEAMDYLARRFPDRRTPKPGYSDREFTALETAARSDVANIRDRIRRGEALLARYQAGPDSVSATEQARAALLDEASTGQVPQPDHGDTPARIASRMTIAQELFLTIPDMAPLLTLFVAVTNRNIETIKELPVEHRILEDRAVELRVVKRRRGQKRWYETVSWEIGKPGRELHTPGGLYLLALELTARSRRFSHARFLWSIWRTGTKAGVSGAAEHDGMFDRWLNRNIYATDWAESRGLVADTAHAAEQQHDDGAVTLTRTITINGKRVRRKPRPGTLQVDFNRLKTSTDVRRTKHAGGHLPSAARTNTVPVLFRNYLRQDPTVIEWAEDIVGDALADAEQSALDAHRRTLAAHGGTLRVITGPADPQHLQRAGLDADTACQAADGDLNTAWTACRDHDHHPDTGSGCRTTDFLDCFHCGNCVITRDHLPGHLALLDALAVRREQMSESDWWGGRYGQAWAAITRDVLVKFSPAEIEQAQALKPDDALLDLVESPWERP